VFPPKSRGVPRRGLDAQRTAIAIFAKTEGLQITDLFGLAITEGIGDGLTAFQATGLGVWVAGSAGFMPVLADAMPTYIEAVTIFAYDDEAGQAGAIALAEKLHARRMF